MLAENDPVAEQLFEQLEKASEAFFKLTHGTSKAAKAEKFRIRRLITSTQKELEKVREEIMQTKKGDSKGRYSLRPGTEELRKYKLEELGYKISEIEDFVEQQANKAQAPKPAAAA